MDTKQLIEQARLDYEKQQEELRLAQEAELLSAPTASTTVTPQSALDRIVATVKKVNEKATTNATNLTTETTNRTTAITTAISTAATDATTKANAAQAAAIADAAAKDTALHTIITTETDTKIDNLHQQVTTETNTKLLDKENKKSFKDITSTYKNRVWTMDDIGKKVRITTNDGGKELCSILTKLSDIGYVVEAAFQSYWSSKWHYTSVQWTHGNDHTSTFRFLNDQWSEDRPITKFEIEE